MTIERINIKKTQDNTQINSTKTNEKKKENNPIVSKALELGINVKSYYIYDENNECIGIDIVKLNAAIKEAMQIQNQQNNKKEEDTFEKKTNSDSIEKTDSKTEAKSLQNNIDKAYTEAVIKYARSLDEDALSTSKEGKLSDEWEAIKADNYKLTSSTTSNTTVLEGVKEFVTNLTNLINSTKNYNAEKATEKDSYFSLETIRDIEDKNNAIEVYGTNIFNSNPFKSAFGTFSEEEYEMAV